MTISLFRRLTANVTRPLALAALLGLALPAGAHAATTVGGLTFEDNAFADVVTDQGGLLLSLGGTADDALTDKDPRTFTIGLFGGAFVELGFTDNRVVNLAGADLAVFELARPTPVEITIAGVTRLVDTVDTGFDVVFPFISLDLNVALVDLSDFGVAMNSTISNVRLGFDIGDRFPPVISLVGALNSAAIPLPAPLLSLLSGLFGLVLLRYRSKRA